MKNDKNSSWNEIWNIQRNFFLQLYERNMNSLKEFFSINKDQNVDYEKLFEIFKESFRNFFEEYFNFSDTKNSQSHFKNYLNIETKLFDLFKKHLHEESVGNLKDMQKIWLQCCKKVYDEIINNQDYHKAYAAFINEIIKTAQ